jgi:8-oxo-dGTP pyrophosphatase MutT (NUDIX family)
MKTVERDGIVGVIVNGKKVLLVKRIWLPFIFAPGKWTFISGGRQKGESYNECVLREIEEEVGIPAGKLKLIRGPVKMYIQEKGWDERWPNALFIFKSQTKRVRLNIENMNHRWATLSEIENENNYYNVFADSAKFMRILKDSVLSSK